MEAYRQIDGCCRKLNDQSATYKLLCEIAQIAKTNTFTVPNPNNAHNFKVLRQLLISPDTVIRAQAIRAIRLISGFPDDIVFLDRLSIDLLLARSLDRDDTCSDERVQVLQLVGKIISLNVPLHKSLIMSLIGVCIFSEDDPEQFTQLSLETLRDVIIACPVVACECNAIKVAVQAILDSRCSPALSSSLVLTILSLIDSDRTRYLVYPSLDLQQLFAVFTHVHTLNNDRIEDASISKRAHNAILLMFKTWTGLFYFADDKNGLRTVIEMLILPDDVAGALAVRDLVFDLIFDIFNELGGSSSSEQKRSDMQSPDFLSNYLGMVVLCLVECGLLDALLYLGVHSNKAHSMQATSLLSAILNTSATLLPSSFNAKWNELSQVVVHAMANRDKHAQSQSQVRARDMLTDLETFVDNYNGSSHKTYRFYNASFTDNSGTDPHPKISFEELAIRTECNSAYFRYETVSFLRNSFLFDAMDEGSLLLMLNNTRVMNTAQCNHLDWEIDACLALMQGTMLWHPTNIFTVLNRTKFLPRLASFMHPYKGGLSLMPWDLAHIRYMRLACSVTRTLCVCGPQTSALLLPCIAQIVEIIKEVCFASNPKNAPFLLSRAGVTCGAGRIYLIMVGILSETVNGMRLVEETGLHDLLQAIVLNPALDYITRVLACHLDYSRHAVWQALLEFWLDNGSSSLRRYLCQQLLMTLPLEFPQFEAWGLPLLTKQVLNKTDVASVSAYILERACDDPTYLSAICDLLASWETQSGTCLHHDRLMLRLVGHEKGLTIVSHCDWISTQIQLWNESEGADYVSELETAIMASLNMDRANIPPRFRGATGDQEWYLERFHDMCFSLSLTLDYSDGRQTKLSSDCVFNAVPVAKTGGLNAFIMCTVIDNQGLPCSHVLADPDVHFRAVLSINSQSLTEHVAKNWFNHICTPLLVQRAIQSAGSVHSAIVDVLDGSATWRFSFANGLALQAVLFSVDIESVGNPPPIRPAPHIFGQISRTVKGCDIVRPHLNRHIDDVLNNNTENLSVSLWTLALVGSSPSGFDLLWSYPCTPCIILVMSKMALTYPVLSIRGTCYYIMGLWSIHSNGRDRLLHLGWEFPSNSALGIAVPSDISSFLHIAPCPSTRPQHSPSFVFPTINTDSPADTILHHIINMGNHVTRASSQEALTRLCITRAVRPYFKSPSLYRAVLYLLSHYHFPLPIRRFVHFSLFPTLSGLLDAYDSEDNLETDIQKLIDHMRLQLIR